jgi:multidrug transporter EmrE-like cation transporter
VHIIDPAKRRQAVLIVLGCTLIVAVAQYLIKLGANRLAHAGVLATVIGIFTILPLFAGYALYGVFTVLFVYALKHGELSILYPLISLGYVWVTITAVLAFHEAMNPLKLIGIAIIVAGVAVLGSSGGGK